MKLLYSVFALCLTCLPTGVQAQWMQTAGPEGASLLSSYTAANGTIFVGTLGGGVYRSTNGAENWEYASFGLTDFDVYELAGRGNTVYAGTRGAGVFVSTDNGANWTAPMSGVLPGRATALLATDNVVLFATADRKFFRSTNEGQSWSVLPTAPAAQVVETLVELDGAIVAGDGVGILHRSTDGGLSWTTIDPGHGNAINSIAQIYNGDVLMGTSGGVYVSQDALQTWSPMKTGMSGSSVPQLFVDDQNDAYAATSGSGVYRWNPAASTWESANANLNTDWIVGFCDLPGADFLTLFSVQLIQKWNAASSTWTERMQGFIAPRLYCITEDAEGRIYTGGASGNAYRSYDGGSSWQRVFGGRTRQIVNAVIPISATELVIGTQGDGVYYSTDAGVSWVPRNDGLGNSSIYAMHRSGSGKLFAASAKGLFVSHNNGLSWTASDGRFMRYTNAVSGVASYIGAAMDSGRVLLSSDDGLAWREARLPTTEDVVFVKRMPWGALIAAVYNVGLFVSPDDGATWSLLTAHLASTYPGDLLFVAGKLYYASYGAGVETSTDRGATWTTMNDGLTNRRMSALLRARDGYLYASSQGAGVFRSAMQIVGVEGEAPAADGLTLLGIWPQPLTTEGYIRFFTTNHDNASLQVFDATGRRVMERAKLMNAGENSFTVESSRLTPGMYQFRITAGGASASGRFVVVR
jgi:photosystem II stability/assembly factor-like uncharacterized protein